MCQNCGKNEVTFRYTQIVNGVKKEMNLCDKCARELGLKDMNFSMPISFSSFLSDFFDDYSDNLLPSFINRIEITYDVEFVCNTNCTPAFGDVVEFTLIDEFNPIVISNDTIDVSIKRTSIIGYYD